MFGTGGQILSKFKELMGLFALLKTLELRDLLLEGCEGLQLLDEVKCLFWYIFYKGLVVWLYEKNC